MTFGHNAKFFHFQNFHFIIDGPAQPTKSIVIITYHHHRVMHTEPTSELLGALNYFKTKQITTSVLRRLHFSSTVASHEHINDSISQSKIFNTSRIFRLLAATSSTKTQHASATEILTNIHDPPEFRPQSGIVAHYSNPVTVSIQEPVEWRWSTSCFSIWPTKLQKNTKPRKKIKFLFFSVHKLLITLQMLPLNGKALLFSIRPSN